MSPIEGIDCTSFYVPSQSLRKINELLLDKVLTHPLLLMVQEAIHHLTTHPSGEEGLLRDHRDTGALHADLDEAQRAEEVLNAQPVAETAS